MIYESIEAMIGNTPLLYPKRYLTQYAPNGARLLCKLECCNPAGSVKDRAARQMLDDAECSGALRPGAVIIEPTSGNTGIGLAAVAIPRGYRVILTMPDTMSEERQRLLRAYGAELVLTPGALGMQGAVDRAVALAADIPNSYIPSQFDNPSNPRAHVLTTAPEIWRDTDGKVDVFVAGVGTGGTLSGCAQFLKEKNPACHIVAVEPAASPLLSTGKSGPHGLQGIGANFVPAVLDLSVCDEIQTASEQDATTAARRLARTEGVLCGISAGAALHVATQLAGQECYRGKTIVVLLPDTGERYLSTALFGE